MADLATELEKRSRETAENIYNTARQQEQDPASFRFTTDFLKQYAKATPEYVPYYNEFLKRDKAPAYTLDELAGATPATPSAKKVAAAIQQPTAGQQYEDTSTDSEAVIPGSKVEYKKPKKATGATGAAGPAPKNPPPQQPPPQRPSGLNNPALENFVNSAKQNAQIPDWRDRAAAQADSLQNQFHGEPQMVGYHWFHGTGGVSGGNDAGMIAHFSDGTSRWINTSIPGKIPQGPSFKLTGIPAGYDPVSKANYQYDTEGRARVAGAGDPSVGALAGSTTELLPNGNTKVNYPDGGYGITSSKVLPNGQSRLQQYINNENDKVLSADSSAFNSSSWLNQAINTARGGNKNDYVTPATPQINPGVSFEGTETAVQGVRSAMEDRSALFNKIAQSNIQPPNLNQPKHEEQDSSQSGGNYGG